MKPGLKTFLQRWLVNTVAVLVAMKLVSGIKCSTASDVVLATLILGLLNAFIRPILMLLSLPLLIFTLGLFTLIINALLLYFVGNLWAGFQVHSFKSAFWGALVISIVSFFINLATGTGKSRIQVRRQQPPPPDRKPPGDDGDGPVIDV